MDGLNIAGPLRIIIERSAQLPNTGRQDPSRHRRLGPHHRDQVGLARQLPAWLASCHSTATALGDRATTRFRHYNYPSRPCRPYGPNK